MLIHALAEQLPSVWGSTGRRCSRRRAAGQVDDEPDQRKSRGGFGRRSPVPAPSIDSREVSDRRRRHAAAGLRLLLWSATLYHERRGCRFRRTGQGRF